MDLPRTGQGRIARRRAEEEEEEEEEEGTCFSSERRRSRRRPSAIRARDGRAADLQEEPTKPRRES